MACLTCLCTALGPRRLAVQALCAARLKGRLRAARGILGPVYALRSVPGANRLLCSFQNRDAMSTAIGRLCVVSIVVILVITVISRVIVIIEAQGTIPRGFEALGTIPGPQSLVIRSEIFDSLIC